MLGWNFLSTSKACMCYAALDVEAVGAWWWEELGTEM